MGKALSRHHQGQSSDSPKTFFLAQPLPIVAIPEPPRIGCKCHTDARNATSVCVEPERILRVLPCSVLQFRLAVLRLSSAVRLLRCAETDSSAMRHTIRHSDSSASRQSRGRIPPSFPARVSASSSTASALRVAPAGGPLQRYRISREVLVRPYRSIQVHGPL